MSTEIESSEEHCDIDGQFDVYVVVSCTVCIIGIIGNVALLVTLLREKRSSMNSLLVTLTMVDVVFLVTNLALIFLFDMEYLQNLSLGSHLASVVTSWILLYFVRWSQLSGIWITVQISLERWLAISRPIKGRLRLRQTKLLSAGIVAVSVLYELPDFLCVVPSCETSFNNNSNSSEEACALKQANWATDEYELYFVRISYVVMSFAVPLISVTSFSVMTLRILRTARDGSAYLRRSTYNPPSNNRYTIMVLLISVIFLLVEMPAVTCRAMIGFQLVYIPSCTAKSMYFAAAVCSMFYASVNFLLYCICSKPLRQQCRTNAGRCVPSCCFTAQPVKV